MWSETERRKGKGCLSHDAGGQGAGAGDEEKTYKVEADAEPGVVRVSCALCHWIDRTEYGQKRARELGRKHVLTHITEADRAKRAKEAT